MSDDDKGARGTHVRKHMPSPGMPRPIRRSMIRSLRFCQRDKTSESVIYIE